MTTVAALIRAEPAARKQLLRAPALRKLDEIVFPKSITAELVDEILTALPAVRTAGGLPLDALVRLFHRPKPLRLTHAKVVLRWNDPFYQFQHLVPATAKGLPDLRILDVDDSATLNPDTFPGAVNGLLLHPPAALETFTARRKKAWARYTAVDGGWAAEVVADAEYPDPYVRLFSHLTKHVTSVVFRAAKPLKPALKKQLAAWQAASGGTLELTEGKRKAR